MQIEVVDTKLDEVPPEVLELIEVKIKQRQLENAIFLLFDQYLLPGIKYEKFWNAEYGARFITNARLGGNYDI